MKCAPSSQTLVHDQAGYVVDAKAAQAADDFLSAAEALADPTALRSPTRLGPQRIGYDIGAASFLAPRPTVTPAVLPVLLSVIVRAALGLRKNPPP
jgi:hypothetical protein